MPVLTIKNILPTTRIAIFKGSGNRDFTDDDFIFHNFCINEKSFDLPEGNYAIRIIHKEMFFEHVDIDLINDLNVDIENSIDPTSKTIGDLEEANYFLLEYFEKSKNVDINKPEDFNTLYNQVRNKFGLPEETEFLTELKRK